MQKPTIGRIVHFNTENGPQVGLVIAVHNEAGCCTLQVCNPEGTWLTKRSVDEGTAAGTWMWPPRS